MNNKKSSSDEEVIVEDMMVGATSRNLILEMFEELISGQIVDYCIAYNNTFDSRKETGDREAIQLDFDRF